MKKGENTLRQKIKQLESEELTDSLKWHVLNYVRENYSDDSEIQNFFTDILSYGCESGMVGHLIYYSDTYKFFDTYYDHIEELRVEAEDNIGEPLVIRGDLKNWLAWFGFEETAYRIASQDLEMDV